MGYVFPSEMFLVGSDLSPIENNIDAFLEGLTSWTPQMQTTGLVEPDMVTVKGSDYAEAFAKMNNLFIRNLWGDSLPVIPPTEEYVDWILAGTDLDPDETVSAEGGFKPRGGIAKVRTVAAALAMAGGRPEHLPLLIAAVRAMTDTDAAMQNWNATTNSVIPVFVVNGPIAKQVRLGSGYGLLGPDPVHPASQVLGRAVRIMLQNLGGALPGTGTMAIFGGMRATNAFFAEDDEGVPEGWTTWAEDRGYTRDQNVVTMTIVNSMSNMIWEFGESESNDVSLHAMSAMMAQPDENRFSRPERIKVDNANLDTGIVLMPRAFASSLVSANGYSKKDVKQILWDNSQVSYEKIVSWGYIDLVMQNDIYKDLQPGDMIPVSPVAQQVTVVVAGGDQGGHGYWMATVLQGNVVSAEVELPVGWDDLLYEAEIDIGSAPSTR